MHLTPLVSKRTKGVAIHPRSVRGHKPTETASSQPRALQNLALLSSWAKEKNFPTCRQRPSRLCPARPHHSNGHKHALGRIPRTLTRFVLQCPETSWARNCSRADSGGAEPKPRPPPPGVMLRYLSSSEQAGQLELPPQQTPAQPPVQGAGGQRRARSTPQTEAGPQEGRLLPRGARAGGSHPTTRPHELLLPSTTSSVRTSNAKADPHRSPVVPGERTRGVLVLLWRHQAPRGHFGQDPSLMCRYLHLT